MKHISMMKALRLCSLYKKMSPAQRTTLQQERFQSLVSYARENSPYYAKLKEVHMLRRFQVVKYLQNRVELRLTPIGKIAQTAAFDAASAALRELLAVYGVTNIAVFLSEEPPKQHPISGKFKHIINAP